MRPLTLAVAAILLSLLADAELVSEMRCGVSALGVSSGHCFSTLRNVPEAGTTFSELAALAFQRAGELQSAAEKPVLKRLFLLA